MKIASVTSVILQLGILGLALLSPSGVRADVSFTVNTTDDRLDDDIGDGLCHTSVNTCSLRAAIMQANHLTVALTHIQLPPGIYTLTRPPTGADGEDSGDLNFNAPLIANQLIELIGAGKDSTIIDANQIDGVMRIEQLRPVTIRHLSLRNGDRRFIFPNEGGGILSRGRLTLSDCAIENNQSNAGGGGIYSSFSSSGTIPDATLDILRCTIQSNVGFFGGGVYATGPVRIRDSTIHSNHAGFGGGIYSAVELHIVNSTISQNTADTDGGGIENFSNGSMATAALYNTSVIGNDADHDADMGGGIGGGIYNGVNSRFIAVNSLFASNTLFNAPIYNDCNGVLEVYGWNLLGDTISCTFTGNGAMSWSLLSLNTIDPLLKDNGGSTWTHALLAGSEAIDSSIDNLGCVDQVGAVLTTDQRAAQRVVGLRCDIGAVEFGAVAPLVGLLFANDFE